MSHGNSASAKKPHAGVWRWTMAAAAVLLCWACSTRNADSGLTPEDQAAAQAKESYETLYRGNAETFLNQRLGAHTMPDTYRQQLLLNLQHHLSQVQHLRGGVRTVDVSRAQADASLGLVQVFLLLTYSDGSQEEVVVPMVQDADGQWKLK